MKKEFTELEKNMDESLHRMNVIKRYLINNDMFNEETQKEYTHVSVEIAKFFERINAVDKQRAKA